MLAKTLLSNFHLGYATPPKKKGFCMAVSLSLSQVLQKQLTPDAYKAGHFERFQQSLQWPEEGGGCSWDVLQKSSAINPDPIKVQALNLFSLLIDPQKEESEKQRSVENHLASLDPENRQAFLLGLSKIAPCVAVVFLTYASSAVKRELCRLSFSEGAYEIAPCNWMREVVENGGLYPNGKEFIEQILRSYPSRISKELIYFFFLHNGQQAKQALSSLMRETEVDQWLSEFDAFLHPILEESIEEPLRIPFEKNQRAYFLHLFFANALEREKSFLVALDFNERDWRQLEAFTERTPIAPLVLRWLSQVCEFAEKKQKSDFWQFFCGALRTLPTRLTASDSELLNKIAGSISSRLLVDNFKAFNDLFLQHLPSRKIFALFFYYIEAWKVLERGITLEETVGEIWDKLEGALGFERLFNVCFNGNYNLLELTIYASVRSEKQGKIFAEILKDSERALNRLFAWSRYCLSESKLLPSIKAFLFQELHRKLDAGDLIPRLKQKLIFAGISYESMERFFPSISSSPLDIQQRALCQLHSLFLDREIKGIQLKKLIGSLREDLVGDMASQVWIPRLLKRLPSPTWPFLFYYLASDLTTTRDRLPIWVVSKEEWVNIAGQTLLEMVGNPFSHLEDQMLHAIGNFCSLVTATRITHEMIHEFSLIAPCEKWIPAFEMLASHPFRKIEREFHEYLAESVRDSQTNYVEFIAQRFIAFDREKRKEKTYNIANLEVALFDKPFISKKEEGMQLLRFLVDELNVDFFGYFISHRAVAEKIMKIVKAAPYDGKFILLNWLNVITELNSRERTKLAIFQGIASSYAGIIPFLRGDEFEEIRDSIRTWYREEDVEWSGSSKSDLVLLNQFQPENFCSLILQKVKGLEAKKDWFKIAQLFDSLSTMPQKTELIKEILEEEGMADFRSSYVTYILKESEEGILSGFIHHSVIGTTLTLSLVYDWSQRLAEWLIQKLNEERDRKFVNGDDSDSVFHETVFPVFAALEQVGVLESWKGSFRFPEEVREEFVTVDSAYKTANFRKSELEEKS